MNDKEKKLVRELALRLYFDLPFWKRRNIFKWYIKNNWDVTCELEKCMSVAMSMYTEMNSKLK